MNLGNIRPLVELSQQKIFLSPTEDGITKKITGNLLNLNLSFFVTKSRNFVTSDCPVGYNCSTEEFFMARIPLTPRITAVYSNSEFSRQFKNKSLLIEDRFVKKINQDYFNWDIPQLIIAKSKDDIQMLMKKI